VAFGARVQVKGFTKNLCQKYNIPTARFGIFQNKIDAKKFLEKTKYPTVIKADNLASGKGVYICNDNREALTAINEIFDGKTIAAWMMYKLMDQ